MNMPTMLGIRQYMFKMKTELSCTQKIHVILLAETLSMVKNTQVKAIQWRHEHFNRPGMNLG